MIKKALLPLIFFSTINFAFSQEVLYYCSRPLPSGSWQVYRKNLTTGTIDAITNNTAYNYWWVELSPNHTELLMLRSPYGSATDQYDYVNCEMIKSNADGSNQQIIVADNQYGWFAFGNPHWHPSGNRILMIAQPTNGSQPFYVVTVDTNGNNPGLLTVQFSIDANWSPTGDKIVFIGIDSAGFVDATSFEVFIANYDYSLNSVSNITQLTSDTTRDHDPCFSPNGLQIAFSSSDANISNADITTIDITGANRTAVLNDAGVHGGPMNWGSDGKIYHHSIYIGVTDFTINAYNTNTTGYETFFASASYGYISPYYANFNVLGIGQPVEENISLTISPNPAQNIFTIQLLSVNSFDLIITNLTGEKVYEQTNIADRTEINTQDFTNGIYFVQVMNDKNTFNKKLIIAK